MIKSTLKSICFLCFTIVLNIPLLAQNEKKNWYFGWGTDGIVFDNSNNPVKVSNKYPALGVEGNVTVNDPYTGELLFYTDGITVVNRNHSVMLNGGNLLANLSCSQGVQVCKVPGSCDKYYIISNSSWDNTPGSLYYSIADFSVNPLGEITVKNQLLDGPGYHQALKVIPKRNSNNYWVIGHLYQTGTYKVIEVTPTGFLSPTIYSFNNSGNSWAMEFHVPTGRLVNMGQGGFRVSLFDFDNQTGIISNDREIAPSSVSAAHVGNFSPDGSKLYSMFQPGNRLWQYDFNTSVWTDMNTCCYAHDVETGPNGITYHIHTYNSANPLAQMLNANLSAIGNACGYSNIANPGNFNGEVRRFPDFLILPDPPVANLDTVNIMPMETVSIPVLANDYDPQQDLIFIDSIVYQPKLGNVTISGNVISYQNISGGCGAVDTFVYLIRDTVCMYDTAKVIIHINSIQDSLLPFTYSKNCNHVNFSNPNSPGQNYQWDFGDGTPLQTGYNSTHVYTTAGNYNVSLMLMSSCGNDSVTVSVLVDSSRAPEAIFIIDSTQCSRDIKFRSVSLQTTSVEWYVNDLLISSLDSLNYTISDSSKLSIKMIAINACGRDTLSTVLDKSGNILPDVSFSYSFVPCSKEVVFYSNSSTADSIYWLLGDGTNSDRLNLSHTYKDTGIYSVSLIGLNICGRDTFSSNVIVQIDTGLADFTFSKTQCSSQVIFTNNSTGYFSTYWDFGDGNFDTTFSPVYSYKSVSEFTVKLYVNLGTQCESVIERKINIDGVSEEYVLPNAFSPNSDGVNDVFRIIGGDSCREFNINIYNRWGQQVFSSDDVMFKWDGSFKSKPQPSGTYLYIVNYGDDVISGHVFLVR